MLTLLTLLIFEELHCLKGGTASQELVGEFGFMLLRLAIASILFVNLLVSVLGVVYNGQSQQWLSVVLSGVT